MNRTRLAILLLVATGPGIVASLAGASGLTYSGRSGRLAFATLGSNVDIYSLLPNGQEPMRLTSAKAFDACPAWSRDGGTIAYCSDATGSYEIWTMRADGSGKHRETNLNSNATFPDLSPDGRKIVFSDCAKTCRLMVVDRTTGRASVLIDDPAADDTDPVWSPNGTSIAFMRARPGGALVGAQIFVARADGSAVRQLTKDRLPKGPFGPDWHPKGTLLAYTGWADIWTVDFRGRSRRLTRTKAAEYAPSWSPEGAHIAYLHGARAARRVYVMNANGSAAHPVATRLPAPHLAPSWQPLAR
jgi:Tol biopolymer transport system component